jgi:hypothetical protein
VVNIQISSFLSVQFFWVHNRHLFLSFCSISVCVIDIIKNTFRLMKFLFYLDALFNTVTETIYIYVFEFFLDIIIFSFNIYDRISYETMNRKFVHFIVEIIIIYEFVHHLIHDKLVCFYFCFRHSRYKFQAVR